MAQIDLVNVLVSVVRVVVTACRLLAFASAIVGVVYLPVLPAGQISTRPTITITSIPTYSEHSPAVGAALEADGLVPED